MVNAYQTKMRKIFAKFIPTMTLKFFAIEVKGTDLHISKEWEIVSTFFGRFSSVSK